MRSSGSLSDAQIFSRSDLREIEDDTLGLPPPEPLGEGGPNFNYFLLGYEAFDSMDDEILLKTTHKGRENSQLQTPGTGGWWRTHLQY